MVVVFRHIRDLAGAVVSRGVAGITRRETRIGILAFCIGAAFIPGIVSAAVVPRWIAICFTPFLIEHRKIPLTINQLLAIAFLGWCCLTLLWSPVPLDGVGRIIQLLILAGVFSFGARLQSMRPVYIGMGLGLWISSAFAIIQRWFDAAIIWPANDSPPSGIFINATTAAEITSMVLVGAIANRIYWIVPGLLPTIILSKARGAWLALAIVGIAWTWKRSRKLAILMVAGLIIGVTVLATTHFKVDSNLQRVQIYLDTLNGLTFWGHGIGSFEAVFPYYAIYLDTFRFHVEEAHSDILQAVFELGPGAIILFGLFVVSLMRGPEAERLVLATFLLEGCVGFPGQLPATEFLAACVLGFLCQSGFVLRDLPWPRRAILQCNVLAEIPDRG